MIHPEIRIQDYTYILPQERIASYPLPQRDSSKLLIYNKGIIGESVFHDIPSYLPSNSLMVFNNTKVVPARLFFRKDTGALIEIFCLEPCNPLEYNLSFASTKRCSWRCIIGNVKKWKGGKLILCADHASEELQAIDLHAELLEKEDNSFVVEFSWKSGIPFSQVLEMCGRIPIPPYLNRETETIDNERYQTLYAKYRGSVAAPTAGLHFTDQVLNAIDTKGIDREELCLHVGAGTFLPVKSEFIADHVMHAEPFSVSSDFLSKIYNLSGDEKVISVGTTSTRSLESLYFCGVQCIKATPSKWRPGIVSQWEPYNGNFDDYSLKDSIGALLEYMNINNLTILNLRTQIIIVPSYRFRAVDMLVTNFHQPQSTLLLLISAFVGGDDWKRIYEYAMGHDFRFLSYGDSSLLIR